MMFFVYMYFVVVCVRVWKTREVLGTQESSKNQARINSQPSKPKPNS